MTKQEMFNLAWKGLAGQGWRAARAHGSCAYYLGREDTDLPEGLLEMRCAWGWVDPTGTTVTNQYGAVKERYCGTVKDLNAGSIGLAAELERDDLEFARLLQLAHDGCSPINPAHPLMPTFGYEPTGEAMERNFRALAGYFHLTIPE